MKGTCPVRLQDLKLSDASYHRRVMGFFLCRFVGFVFVFFLVCVFFPCSFTKHLSKDVILGYVCKM